MPLSSAAAIADELRLTAAVADRVAPSLREAERYLRGLKGDPWYDALLVRPALVRPVPKGPAEPEGPLTTQRANAERAESLLALYHALPLLNLSLADGGGVLAVTYTTTAEGTVETRFATAEALEGLRREVLTQAKVLVDGDVRLLTTGEGETVVLEGVSSFSGGAGSVGAI